MSVIDAHQHFWNLERVDYPYLPKNLDLIYRTFEEADLEPLLDAAGVDRTVLVQSMDSFADTNYMLDVAGRWPRVAGVVGWLPLTDATAALTAAEHYQQDPRFVGVRHLISEEPDPDWLLRPDVADGLELLAERRLTFDVVAVTPRQLEHVPHLSNRHPALRMILDHLGWPPIAEGGWEPWAALLRAAAENPNVYAKLSGLATAASWDSWTTDDLRRYVEYGVEVFGPERIMFGGDWPICRLAGDYGRVWEATVDLLRGLADADRDRILGLTATAVYGLT
jgi:L-fuconolactonase